ncbi:2-amino-4-hydroxy-6-hydroxymethyldihydropteridine diphosphokinase [Dokdonella koreensis]|uniref:2-amino-4-hydroxy-6-hydroxymethyldihydropteridine pyrophosphokinase n=1 Tax=Dokdonella koreensis DS-123 TaxID=1300342 RepID=A0A160DXJ5_9GAMM|nr:2-amino-4-hydroxy-6-hydroxymethyldihydropteridine diphosphokinase [Dokdonella koreensis]ANB18693.1 2-amino-4-hydroxy-6-hydroxymethyldihydropteridine pyrophosphokinase [Dokdonella koreensis DS-123]
MKAAQTLAWVGLGSNLADPVAQVRAGLDALAALPSTDVLARSRLYRTAPWGRTDQPVFVNAVARLSTALVPLDLLDALLGIERRHGRDRNSDLRWGPRTLDLDLLLYGDRRIEHARLTIPHPRLRERAFVLVPLAELDPELSIPGDGRVQDLLAAVAEDAGACRVAD